MSGRHTRSHRGGRGCSAGAGRCATGASGAAAKTARSVCGRQRLNSGPSCAMAAPSIRPTIVPCTVAGSTGNACTCMCPRRAGRSQGTLVATRKCAIRSTQQIGGQLHLPCRPSMHEGATCILLAALLPVLTQLVVYINTRCCTTSTTKNVCAAACSHPRCSSTQLHFIIITLHATIPCSPSFPPSSTLS